MEIVKEIDTFKREEALKIVRFKYSNRYLSKKEQRELWIILSNILDSRLGLSKLLKILDLYYEYGGVDKDDEEWSTLLIGADLGCIKNTIENTIEECILIDRDVLNVLNNICKDQSQSKHELVNKAISEFIERVDC